MLGLLVSSLKRFAKQISRALFFATLLGVAVTLCAAEPTQVEVSVSPNPIVQNRMSSIAINTTEIGSIRAVHFPQIDGITWHGNVRGTSTQITNGSMKTSTTFGFVVSKDGEIEIPSFKVETSQGTFLTRPIRFVVGRASSGVHGRDGEEIKPSDLVFMRVGQGDNIRKFYFVGEEIPITVYVLANTRINASIASAPQISEGSAFSVSDVGEAERGEASLNGENYSVVVFQKNLRAMKPGTFNAEFSCEASCVLPSERDSTDPFSSSFFTARSLFAQRGRTVPVSLHDSLEGIEVKPRPPLPDGVLDLGIVSSGKIFAEFSDGKKTFSIGEGAIPAKQGAPLYLDLFIDCARDSLSTPEVSIPEFRTYPPEISSVSESAWEEKSASSTPAKSPHQIRWMLIPLKDGNLEVNLKFARLDPTSGGYENLEISQKIESEKDETLGTTQGSTEVFTGSTGDFPQKTAVAKNLATGIFYNRPITPEALERGKKRPHDGIFSLALGGGISLLAIVFLGFVELRRRRRSRVENSPEISRRIRANSRKGEILKKLKASTAENFDELVRTEVADYVADVKGEPSVDAAKASLKNPEIAEIFSSAELAGYNPGARGTDFEKSRKALISAIRRGAFALLVGILVSLSFPQNLCAEDKISSAQEAYANGDFQRACDEFSSLTESSPFSADLWFDLGNTFFQNKEYARALVCYERSHRLDLSRTDALANMNAACRKLGIPIRGETKTPVDVLVALRDSFGTTTWAIFAGAGIWLGVLIFLSGGLIRRRSRAVLGIVVGGIVCVFCATNAIWQQCDLFDEATAIVLEKTELRNLPVENSAQEIAEIPAGETVKVLETRERASLVRAEFSDGESAEGWLDNSSFAKILSTSPLR